MERRELKSLAKAQISGNVIILFILGLITEVVLWVSGIQNAIFNFTGVTQKYITGILRAQPNASQISPSFYANLYPLLGMFLGASLITIIVYYVIGSPLRVSLSHTYLELASNERKPKFAMLGYGFKKCWVQSILLQFLVGLFIALWSLLLIIPGIIKAYAYSMSYYIMAENPDINALDAIAKSREMMRGHKFDLFVLSLSFLLWILLVGITFGIAIIYVGPYIEATMANFYLKLKNSNSENELA